MDVNANNKSPYVRYLAILCLLCGLVLVGQSFAQSGAIIPQHGAGHAVKPSCVILKRMGPADQITSHMYSFGIRGKQFQYVEGKLPDGFPFHGRLTDHDVRNLQSRGAEVIVLNQNYTPDELKQGRTDCQQETGTTPIQVGESTPTQAPAGSGTPSPATAAVTAPAHAEPGAQAQLYVTSSPNGADIEIDGIFVGSTPSTLGVAPGQHDISIKKAGFKLWERRIGVSSGQVNINAALDAAGNEGGTGQQGNNATKQPQVESLPQTIQRPTISASFIGASSDSDPRLRQDGIPLSHITEGGTADHAGLKVGDVVLAIDDHYVFTGEELASEIRRHSPGTSVRIRYRRRSLIYDSPAKLSGSGANEEF